MADLVGHNSQSTCCRFNPAVLTTEVNNPKKTFCVVALADEEGLISVWSSSKTSPLLVIRDCFEDAVTDITWDKDGAGTGTMLAASLDGTITIVRDFLEGSVPLKEAELDRHLQALYGKSAKDINKQQTPVKQNSLALQYSKINMVKSANTIHNNHTNSANQGHINSVSSSGNISTSKASSVPVKHTISLNKDGKKRITPVQIYNPTNSSSTTYENGSSSYTQSSPPSPSNNLGTSRPRTDLNIPKNSGTSHPRNDLNVAKKPKLSHDNVAPGLKVSLLRNEIIVTLPSYPKSHMIEFIVQNKNTSKSDKNVSVANIFKDKVHVLRAVSLASPRELHTIANIGYQTSCLTSISLFESPIENNNMNNSNSGSVNGTSPLWRCAVTGQATCISGIQHSKSSSNEEVEGVCVIGCSDGTLHLLNLSAGLRLLPPLVVGMAIANIDMVVTNSIVHILVLTVDGSLCGWSLNIETSELSCIFSADVKPVIYSVKSKVTFGDYPKLSEPTAAPENLIHAFIEKCYFFPSPSKILPTIHVRSGKVGVGTDGSLQVFTYNYTAKTWMRTADTRHVLSSASSGPANYPLTELDKLQKDSTQSSGITPSAITSLSTIMNRPQFR